MKLDKKELIRQSAAQVIAEEGYHETTVKMIAEKAGIAVGTIYLYFKTKEEILDYIFLVEHDKRVKFLDELQMNSRSALDTIQLFLEYHFNELKENPSISRVLVQEAVAPLMSSSDGIKKYFTKLPDILTEILEKAIENEEVRSINPVIVSRIIFYIIRSSVYLLHQDSNPNWACEVKEQIVSLLFQGIQK